MRRVINTLLATAMCVVSACASTPIKIENNQQNQAVTHPTCKLGADHVRFVQDELHKADVDATVTMVYCGPLQKPHDNLGLAMFEIVGFLPSGDINHLITVLKFAEVDAKWAVISEPEVWVDFTQHASDSQKSTL